MSADTSPETAATLLENMPQDWRAFAAFSSAANRNRAVRNNLRDALAGLDSERDAARLGLGYATVGEPSRALPFLRLGKDDLSRLLAARALSQLGQLDAARAGYEALVRSPAVGARARTWLLELCLRQADPTAIEGLVAACKQGGSPAEVAFAEGVLAEARGDHEGAMASFRVALEHDKTHAEACFRLAYRADLEGDDDTAIDLYERFARGELPPQLGALVNLAILYEDRDEALDALRLYQLVVEADPTNRRARLYLADAIASTEQFYDESRERKADKQNAVLRIPVTDFELSVRARNCLQRMNIHTLGDLVCRTESELLSFKNFGETSLQEVKDILGMKGLRLGMFPAPERGLGPSLEDLVEVEDEEELDEPVNVRDRTIGALDLSVRSRSALAALGISTVGELADTSEATLLSCRNFGQTSLDEIKAKLTELGLGLSTK